MSRPSIDLLKAFTLSLGFISLLSAPPSAYADSYQTAVQLYSQKKYPEAIEALKKANMENPNNPNAYYYVGLCHHALGNRPMAKKAFQSVIERFPTAAAAQNARQALASVDSAPTAQEATTMANSRSEPEEETISATKGVEGHMVVRAEVNGRPIEMMFDTGAEACIFGKNHMQQLGISLANAKPGPPIQGTGGSTQSVVVEADVRLGRIKRHIPLYVQEKMMGDPLMGQMFFRGYQCAVDNTNGTIRFIKQGRAVTSMSTNTIDVPFRKYGSAMVVRGKVNGRDCDMIFDTGASEVVVSADSLKQLGLELPADATTFDGSGATGATRAAKMNVDRIEVGPLTKTNFAIKVVPKGPPYPLVGQSFHGDRRFVIDNDKCLIRFPR